MRYESGIVHYVKNNLLLYAVLMVMFAGRIAIGGQGYLDDSDEVDYYAAESAFSALLHFDIVKFSEAIAVTEGKPTETLLKTFQVPFHYLWAWIAGVPRYSQKALWFFGVINIIISLLVLFVFYLLQLRLGIRKNAAVLGITLLGVFINFNLYTRHLLSYDLGLLFQMSALYFVLSQKITERKKYAIAGVMSALGFTAYHGYFMFIPIIVSVIFYTSSNGEWNFIKRLKIFSGYFILLLILYEMFFWIGGNSFIKETLKIGGSIGQGSYSEGFSYVWIYLSKIEGIAGIGLLTLFIISIIISIRSLKNKVADDTEKLLLLAFIAYLCYGFAVYVLMKFVFYGRILHMYYPFMVLGAIFVFEKIQATRAGIFHAACYILLLVQYILNIANLNSFTYPRSVIDSFGLADKNQPEVQMQFLYELDYSENYTDNPRNFALAHISNKLGNGNYDIVNTCFFQHHPDRFMSTYNPYNVGRGKVIFSKQHFMSHPVYTFEYCSEPGRNFYLKNNFQILIVKQP